MLWKDLFVPTFVDKKLFMFWHIFRDLYKLFGKNNKIPEYPISGIPLGKDQIWVLSTLHSPLFEAQAEVFINIWATPINLESSLTDLPCIYFYVGNNELKCKQLLVLLFYQ